MLLTLLINFEGDRTVKYFLLSIEGRVCRELFAGKFKLEATMIFTNLDQLGPTWTNLDQLGPTEGDAR